MKLVGKKILAAAIVAASVLASAAHANVVTLNLNAHINGVTPSANDVQPWLVGTLTDVGNGMVKLVMTNNLVNATTKQATGEFVDDWLFNVDPSVSNLTYAYVSGYQAVSVTDNALTNGTNAIKAGLFNINFTDGKSGNNRFTGGMTSTYTFSGTGLSTASFLTPSTADGNNPGGYYSAADVAGIYINGVGGYSGSIGAPSKVNVPEPATLLLLGLGLLGVSISRRRS